MCKTHSRAERGRLRQTTSSRKFASSTCSAFCVIGNSIGFSYYTKNTQKYRIFPVSLCFAIHCFCFYAILIFTHFSSAVCADVIPDSLFQNCAGAKPHTVQLQRNWTDSGNGYRQSSGYGYMFPHYRPEFLPEFRHFPCQT